MDVAMQVLAADQPLSDAGSGQLILAALLGIAAVVDAGATPVVHCCAPEVPVQLLVDAGAQGVSVDLSVLAVSTYDALAELLEQDKPVFLGVVPATDPAQAPTETALTEQVLRFLDMLGLDPGEVPSLVVTPSCGLAGASVGWAREALRLSAKVAANLG
jgi:methionine synthase II (cobalamin-independent)